jgi:hypothetical protein
MLPKRYVRMRADEMDCFCIGGKGGAEEETGSLNCLGRRGRHRRAGGADRIFCFKMAALRMPRSRCYFLGLLRICPERP